jgi:hypothetical protein
MCAAGSQEITFAPRSGKSTMSSTAAVSIIRLRWVSCTPLGGPVVPEV